MSQTSPNNTDNNKLINNIYFTHNLSYQNNKHIDIIGNVEVEKQKVYSTYSMKWKEKFFLFFPDKQMANSGQPAGDRRANDVI